MKEYPLLILLFSPGRNHNDFFPFAFLFFPCFRFSLLKPRQVLFPQRAELHWQQAP
jgi:predicted esterase